MAENEGRRDIKAFRGKTIKRAFLSGDSYSYESDRSLNLQFTDGSEGYIEVKGRSAATVGLFPDAKSDPKILYDEDSDAD